MKKLLTGSAIALFVIFTAILASASSHSGPSWHSSPFSFTSTAGDGYLYLVTVGGTGATTVTEDLTVATITLDQAVPYPTPVPHTEGGADLFTGTLTLPVGAGAIAEVFNISAIRGPEGDFHIVGQSSGGAIVRATASYGPREDRTSGTKPYPVKQAMTIAGSVLLNGSNFTGQFEGVLYGPEVSFDR